MASTFRQLRVAWTAGAVLVCLLPAISLGSDEVRYVPPKSPAVCEKLEWFRDQKLTDYKTTAPECPCGLVGDGCSGA